jgi:hypothetical protein
MEGERFKSLQLGNIYFFGLEVYLIYYLFIFV